MTRSQTTWPATGNEHRAVSAIHDHRKTSRVGVLLIAIHDHTYTWRGGAACDGAVLTAFVRIQCIMSAGVPAGTGPLLSLWVFCTHGW